ncbi:MAG TPA: hypothetical protein VG028_17085 [Terriglobia bacterium]|nr:hypothetical protein [Terriglobia bacterium]
MEKTKAHQKRVKLRKQFWPGADAWTGSDERGWFFAPRTLPLVLGLIASKDLSGRCDPTRVYLELWSRHFSGGIIEMKHEGDHAYAAGYVGNRGVRTWQERMKILEKNGFIKVQQIGNQQYAYVLLVHPTTAINQLRNAGKVPDIWWQTYCARQIETKEPTYKQRMKAKAEAKVVTTGSSTAQSKKSSIA